MSETLSCEVLIVGLGPVGAALADLLADEGVDVIAIERWMEVYPLPRAVHFDDEIMRVFQRMRVVDAVMEHARPAPLYEFLTAKGEVLLSFAYNAQAVTPNGWATGFMFHQPGLEGALRAKLAASRNARVMLGATFDGLVVVDGGVETSMNAADGSTIVRSRYVVGCDGASSRVRRAIGVDYEDLQFDEPWLVVDVVPKHGAKLPDRNLQICDPARPTTCVQSGPGRHRWEIMMLPGESAENVLRDDFIAGEIGKWGVEAEIVRKAVYRFHGRVARRWRDGPVLLAGDAAHETPPFAGQGMCAGIRDAANLSWKLAAVLKGEASPALLDTYQIEREPNARAYIQLAIDMGRVVCTTDPQIAAGRDEQMLAARRAGVSAVPPAAPPLMAGPGFLEDSPGAGEIFPQAVAPLESGGTGRLDDALGAGAWLIGAKPSPAAGDVTVVELADPRLAPFRAALSEWLTSHAAAAVLVRPDRRVFGSGDAANLVIAWHGALGVPRPAAAA